MKLFPLSLIIKLKILKRFLFYKSEYNSWLQSGKPIPPPHLAKRELLKKYQNKYKINILVETGTYLGEMVFAQKDNYKSIYSIEIQPELYTAAKRRFMNYKNINILFGDSGEMMSELVQNLEEKALFWLDGHYSGGITGKSETECPIFNELLPILNDNKNHIIIIDDANCFIGKNDYPTIDALIRFVESQNKYYSSKLEDNAIILEINN
jgi:hypothetical protein